MTFGGLRRLCGSGHLGVVKLLGVLSNVMFLGVIKSGLLGVVRQLGGANSFGASDLRVVLNTIRVLTRFNVVDVVLLCTWFRVRVSA